MRNIGIILITIAALYLAITSNSSLGGSNNWNFRSRARDQILKNEYKNQKH